MTSLTSTALDEEALKVLRRYELEARQMSGWVLDYAPAELGQGPDWCYEDLLKDRISSVPDAAKILDIGTGGGEVLATVLQELAPRSQVFTTEEYVANAPVAAKKLATLARVVRASGEQLPFADNSFRLVSSRHTAIEPREISRVLNTGGVFMTQQVASNYLIELKDYFDDFTIYPDHFEQYTQGLQAAGLEILQAKQYCTQSRFEKFEHLVYMLAVAPWFVPGFSLDTHLNQIKALFDATSAGRELTFTSGYYLIEARQP